MKIAIRYYNIMIFYAFILIATIVVAANPDGVTREIHMAVRQTEALLDKASSEIRHNKVYRTADHAVGEIVKMVTLPWTLLKQVAKELEKVNH